MKCPVESLIINTEPKMLRELRLCCLKKVLNRNRYTVCPGSSDHLEKILNIFASENEVYTIFLIITKF